VARYVELRRHTDSDRDVLTAEGVRTAVEIGRRLMGPYVLLVSSGAQRDADARVLCLCPHRGGQRRGDRRAGLSLGCRGSLARRLQSAGSGELSALREADPEPVREDSERLAGGLRRILDRPPDQGRALAVGHGPTNEAAVFGLTGELLARISKVAGVLVVAEGDRTRVEPLP
jgi:broad specificity phosphatase PhoE